ncbi:MAG: response regulator transcription factor [Epsilonproteobacteria bacterium]|nr:response regulator transcription factor [Campylobacterota bacterium]OIO13586.1 MAG: transcriptional regulator [Helicobacteraceae bacterium CG1_02_36_14]PIP10775.1 MAG: transcriptional regulator [Sulfurimonas sp. CG23_combo_of_CG06-09_8_20_14_all_36_33]PIS24236.1 MAG: DNA-binding response regulator [Sulfurimonas sp. CG08_land_8_20_14_0_20_36_33]PIU36041.1 MAG: DNA-binding response regulator [Sulfurimonas sp. CG07_land_8_20_14_0_80_36_56]PIV04386.1 MAG: DNA-binding response regulator [Sulfuri
MLKERVIIVEDDEITALNLKLSLEKHGYRVEAISTSVDDAKKSINKYKPEIMIIDISLQETNDGIELAKVIRKKHNIPFIFLTSYSDNEIIAQAKLTEPYGYIVKPFNPNSLHATIQMALFKYAAENERKNDITALKVDKLNLEKLLFSKRPSNKPIVPFGEEYHLDISICETFYKGKKIKLTKKENAFLRLLVAQLGIVVTFEQAMNYVWEENGTTENSVRTLVWRLRNKLETDIIKNASGIGYYIEE